ncbi:MAG: FAD-binding oxidoreductase, partial [Bacteroidia bacterium]|nr:FAD-binding oxidoreductase [Bacteroidia bacterium]
FLADEAFDFAREYYLSLEKELGARFVQQMPLFKIFNNQEQQDDWLQKANSPEYEQYLSKEIKHFSEEAIKNDFGTAEVLNTFLLNTQAFLNATKLFLVENASYRNETFHSDEVVLEPDAVHYRGIHAKKIIFCTGYKAASDKYFNWLPFNLCKGERLNIEFESFQLEKAISNNVVLIPEDNNYILGSTYSWDELNEEPTAEAREELSLKFQKISNSKFQISNHLAAIRPTTIDRRPFLGLHPELKQLAIFNGMGTKSVMFCPFLAKKMCALLLNGIDLPSEVNIQRHLKHFSA